MAAFLRFLPFQTSSVWRFKDPDTGYMHAANSRPDLVRSIVSYRANNRLAPIEQLESVLENYLCGLPENCGRCEQKLIKRGFLTYLKGGISLLEWVLFPADHTTDRATAEARAAQCVQCPYNVFPDKGPFLRWSDELALEMVGDKRVLQHELLGNCEVCSCILKASVWYKGDPKLAPAERKKAESVKCWKLDWYKEHKNG